MQQKKSLKLNHVEPIVLEVSDHEKEASPRSFSDFYNHKAIVLLGEQGLGKTSLFQSESLRESNAEIVSVRTFLSRAAKNYHGKVLYLDGLDEQRAGKQDGRPVIDNIVSRLDEIDCPAFRISCREADWYRNSDKRQLENISKDKKVTVLKLLPLNREQIKLAINGLVDDPEAFITQAIQKDVYGLLANPLTLTILLTVIKEDGWPTNKLDLLEKFSEILANEINEEHALAGFSKYSINEITMAAGCLCAVSLLADLEGFSRTPLHANDNTPHYLNTKFLSEMQNEVLEVASKSRLFQSISVNEDIFAPVHRVIAEYLAARFIVSLLEDGLSLNRILNLIADANDNPVAQFRGLYAWLACMLIVTSPKILLSLNHHIQQLHAEACCHFRLHYLNQLCENTTKVLAPQNYLVLSIDALELRH